MTPSLRFVGGAELQRTLEALSSRLSRQVQREALTEAAQPIRLTMAQLAPRAPGVPDIAANIVIGTARLLRQIAVAIGPAKGFRYGFFQEYGTVRHRAQPFMRPAFDRHVVSGATLRLLIGSLWRALIGRGVGSTRASGGGTGL
jgi:HK97 gp10 family phage protein